VAVNAQRFTPPLWERPTWPVSADGEQQYPCGTFVGFYEFDDFSRSPKLIRSYAGPLQALSHLPELIQKGNGGAPQHHRFSCTPNSPSRQTYCRD